MIDRENEFFGDMKSDNIEETNTSSTGINYGERNDKAGIKNIIIAVSAGAVFAAILVLLLSPKTDKRETNNFAEIPTLSQPTGPIKIEPTNQIPDTPDVFETATIYNMQSTEPAVQPQPIIKSVEPAPVPTKAVNKLPAKKVAKAEPKKTTPAPAVKKTAPVVKKETKPAPAPEKKLIETKTNIPGEVEVSTLKVQEFEVIKNVGVWNVQLVSTSSEAAAHNEWETLLNKYPSIRMGLDS